MKNISKLLIILFISSFVTSCSEDENLPEESNENLFPERFKGIEIGNADLILPQSNVDVHVEFDYEAPSKVTKMYFDVKPDNVPSVKDGETKWELNNHLVPLDYYKGEKKPHIHYHVYFDESNSNNTSFKAAEGIYKFKISIEHEDGTKSYITKKFEIVRKFKNMKIGDNNSVKLGNNTLKTEFDYSSGDSEVTEIKYEFWFKEWRDGQNKPVGKWDKVSEILPKNLYEGKKNPSIKFDYNLIEGMPEGEYWLNIYVKETSYKEMVKLSIPIKVTK